MRVAEKIGLKYVGDGFHGNVPCKSYVMTIGDFGDRR